MLEHFGKLLDTVPFAKTRPGITALTIRAVDSSEAPLEEHDLRSAPATPEGCTTLARVHEQADCCYEAKAHWDLWSSESGSAKLAPQPVEITCNGEEYDAGAFREAGHFSVELGPEDLFVGTARSAGGSQPRQNARALQTWVQQVRAALPVERISLWSEGEEDFEAHLDGALANS